MVLTLLAAIYLVVYNHSHEGEIGKFEIEGERVGQGHEDIDLFVGHQHRLSIVSHRSHRYNP